VKVWLDDVREAPAGWVRVKTPEETIELLRSGEVAELSLDHDLGLDTEDAELTGYDVLLWLERQVAEERWSFPPPSIRVHSANPIGRSRMERAIASIERLHGDRPRDGR
jgi:hypothetical protein